MTYACNDCSFLFYRAGDVNSCPRCDSAAIREATGAERDKLREMAGGALRNGCPGSRPGNNA